MEYKLVQSMSMGYAVFLMYRGCWQQITKWYTYLGNLERFNDCAKLAFRFDIID